MKNARLVIFACFNRLLWISLAKATQQGLLEKKLDEKPDLRDRSEKRCDDDHVRQGASTRFFAGLLLRTRGLLLPAAEVQEVARRKTSNRRDRRKRAEGEFV